MCHPGAVGAFVYNAAGIPFAAGVLYPIIGVLLNPIIAGAAVAIPAGKATTFWFIREDPTPCAGKPGSAANRLAQEMLSSSC